MSPEPSRTPTAVDRVADAYVAMTSHRPYRFAMPAAKALAEIRDHSGTQFDPKVVDALIGILDGDPARIAVGVG
jgi:HD-GYP domain-containing protein (c-di-GMP phosphodiesterase class II)